MQLASSFNERDYELESLVSDLPKLPRVVRYYDEFVDEIRTIERFSEENRFEVNHNGSKLRIDFGKFRGVRCQIIKGLFFYLVTSEFKMFTVYNYIVSLNNISEELLTELLLARPRIIKNSWAKLFAQHSNNAGVFRSVKALLVYYASFNMCGWSPAYSEFISRTLASPLTDKYAGIRSGDVFLSIEEEVCLVRYLDELSNQLNKDPFQIQNRELESSCMLACSYLFGMRPLQIAILTMRDFRIWKDANTDLLAVHLTFKMIKQKIKSKAFPLTRRINRDWIPLFVELYQRAKAKGKSGDVKVFEINSSNEVSSRISELATRIVGVEVSATDLRHTAAQRLVDSGANQEEVAEFMGHSDIRTCLVYYATSPTQAERVNKALGISPIYQQVVKIAHDKFISPNELARLKGDQQIAGVPHGIAITGIGGCSTGQPSCPYNPITSCYGCQKFMPVSDLELHQKVLTDLRCVVMQFEKSSRSEGQSPAFMQLNRTISHVQRVINELEVSNA